MSTLSFGRNSHLLVWFFLAFAVFLLAWGVVRYGLSSEVKPHFWSDIFSRFGGPMTFRFFLQPAMALVAQIPDGIRDERAGFFWATLISLSMRTGRLREGLAATARILLLGISMDIIYQWRAFDRFYPFEALVMAVVLALLPYLIFREIIWVIRLLGKR